MDKLSSEISNSRVVIIDFLNSDLELTSIFPDEQKTVTTIVDSAIKDLTSSERAASLTLSERAVSLTSIRTLSSVSSLCSRPYSTTPFISRPGSKRTRDELTDSDSGSDMEVESTAKKVKKFCPEISKNSC